MAFVGKLVWSALGWALPGLSASWLYLLASGVGVALVASVAFLQGAEGKAAALATEKAACELRISSTATEAAATMADLLEQIAKEAPNEPTTPAEEAAQCKRSKLCRGAK